MKLYSEEQVKRAMTEARLTPIQFHELNLKSYTPIELPSEQDIEKESMKFYDNDYDNNDADYYFEEGAKWVIEQIKEQNQ